VMPAVKTVISCRISDVNILDIPFAACGNFIKLLLYYCLSQAAAVGALPAQRAYKHLALIGFDGVAIRLSDVRMNHFIAFLPE
jgi:hypothetical protein